MGGDFFARFGMWDAPAVPPVRNALLRNVQLFCQAVAALAVFRHQAVQSIGKTQ